MLTDWENHEELTKSTSRLHRCLILGTAVKERSSTTTVTSAVNTNSEGKISRRIRHKMAKLPLYRNCVVHTQTQSKMCKVATSLQTHTAILTRNTRTSTNRNKLNRWANYQQNMNRSSRLRIRYLKRKTGADNIPQYVRRKNLKRMST